MLGRGYWFPGIGFARRCDAKEDDSYWLLSVRLAAGSRSERVFLIVLPPLMSSLLVIGRIITATYIEA
jgi:hypothetical protein